MIFFPHLSLTHSLDQKKKKISNRYCIENEPKCDFIYSFSLARDFFFNKKNFIFLLLLMLWKKCVRQKISSHADIEREKCDTFVRKSHENISDIFFYEKLLKSRQI